MRDFRPEDVHDVNELLGPLAPELPAATDRGFLHWLTRQPEKARLRSWVALRDAEIVGWAYARINAFVERDDVGSSWAAVREDARGRGIGSELASAAEAYLVARGARKLWTYAHEGSPGERFASARGYVRTRTEQFSMVAPPRADTSALEALQAEKRAEGFRVVPLRDVRDRPRELYRLFMVVNADVPAEEPETVFSYEDWLRCDFEQPDLDDDASFVVLTGERIVALCLLLVDREKGVAEHEMTGTDPEFRRRGLARLVKLASIRAAADLGVRELWTGNDSENPGMLALNTQLGYEPRIVRAELSRDV